MNGWQKIPRPKRKKAVVFPLRLRSGGVEISAEGFAIVDDAGCVRAFVNRCPHARMPLDWGDGEFFDDQGLLLCRMHGARFAPQSGACVSGPCAGKGLWRIPIRSERGRLWVPQCVEVDA